MTQLSREGVPATVSVEVLDVWDEPAHEKDYWSRQTQLILGERVLILAEVGDWASIVAVEQPSHKDPHGYPGWVRRGSLVNGWSQADKVAVVMVLFTQGRSQPDRQAGVVQRIPFDARLAVNEISGGWVQVILPDQRMAWLPLQDCRLTNLLQDPPSLDQFYATAQTFLDIPYLWGGAASGSLDCSGFLYRLYHAYGITLPRDAGDQALSGAEVQGGRLSAAT